MTTPPIFKRAYEGVAMFAIANLFLLVGVAAYAVSSGVLDKDKAVRIASVLRGDPIPEAPEEKEATADEMDGSNGESVETSVDAQGDLEILRYESDRLKAELDQQLALVHSMMLRVTTARETFARERQKEAQRKETEQKTRADGGFKKQVEIFEALKPKVALEHLLSLDDPADAAAILMQMKTRKAKSIIESAKSGDQMLKMKEILRRVREASPEQSQAPGNTTP